LNKIVVYTALFTDDLHKIHGTLSEYDIQDVEFICYTNTPYLKSDTWDIRIVDLEFNNPRKTARQYKLLPHKYLPDYSGWIWIDNSCSFRYHPIDLYNHYITDDYDMSLHKHCDRNSVKEESEICVGRGLDDSDIISSQLDRYIKCEGYSDDNGLYETGILMRKNNNVIKQFNQLWWGEVNNNSIRDQLSFPYVLYKIPNVRLNAIEETFVAHQSVLGRKQSDHFGSIPRQENHI
jgi:hypothetical protein